MRSAPAPFVTWPVEERGRFRAAGYWTDETFADLVTDRTDRFADRLALVATGSRGGEVRWTYARLGQEARLAAGRLAAARVEPGDRVVVALPNVAEHVAVVLGCFLLGAVPVMALAGHRELELTHFCAVADAAALVVCGDTDGTDHLAIAALVRSRVAERGLRPPVVVDVQRWGPADTVVPAPVPRTHADDLGLLQLSGGTTGVSKLIPRTHADYLYSVRASVEICDVDASTVALVTLPAGHNFSLSSPGVLGVLHAGGTVVLARDPSPRTAFRLIERERVTTAALVPPLAQAWLAAARRRSPDLSSLRTVQVGGARLADAVAGEIEPVLGARLQQVFGMAEGLVCYTRDDDADELVRTTQGRPISADDEIRVVDADDGDVPDGTEGSLLTRGPYTIRGYYGAGEADEASFTADGFYRTGDRVRRLASGHLVVTGRDKDQINRGGEKVSCTEVEGVVLTHPAVRDAVAVGLPDPYLGERACLVVRLEPDAPAALDAPAELAAYLRAAGLATYKIPDEVVVVDELPATNVGKNSRRDLRRLLTERLVAR
ncbi:(2,3-dihydroxybenzoyl)adenylate synthase [Cellulomonas sp. HZM]|uniref:(2,3-dihydroxybenzoyl)adenylate synthase n=1 Tax=Cellulomonas sp. HZM TaxID=1454010 RepID=UPI0004934DA5|nr:AMP-binding protein [Cellulomonas sp. HZM]